MAKECVCRTRACVCVKNLNQNIMKKLQRFFYGIAMILPFCSLALGPTPPPKHMQPFNNSRPAGISVASSSPCTAPSVTIISSTARITKCYGTQCSRLTATATGGQAPYTYDWNNGQTTQTIAACYNATETFTVRVTDAAGCSQTATTTVEVVDACCDSVKVIVCIPTGTLCVDSAKVDSVVMAKKGSVGPCTVQATASRLSSGLNETTAVGTLPLRVYPNPFNDATVFEVQLAREGRIKIEIFDVSGKRTAELSQQAPGAGTYQLSWNGTNSAGNTVANGIYFCRITAGTITQTIRIQKSSDR